MTVTHDKRLKIKVTIENKDFLIKLKGLYYYKIVVVSAVESPGCSFTCWMTIIKTTIIKIIAIPGYFPRV